MERVTFEGAHGDKLAARLEMPAGPVRACALFAHCFTCSKDIFAAVRISRALAERGIAVLRFDFTGLGESEGEFADTNFTSNVEDLVAAAAFMRERIDAPALLVGHSLGGAAVLRAAHDIPDVCAIATIGAPFDPEHIANLLGPDARAAIAAGETRVVEIAGRSFEVQPQFLIDIADVDAPTYIGELRKPLLLFHAPRDHVVGIDNATKIFVAAKHPKSFVSLDDADHLVSRHEDATFIASVLAAWAERYLPARPSQPVFKEDDDDRRIIVAEMGTGKFTHQVKIGPHEFLADEPEEFEGDDRGPSPYELLLAALGTCTSMTMRMYVARKGWEVGKLGVELVHQKIHAKDCADCGEGATGRIDRIERHLTVEGELSDEQRAKLAEIADKCPVHRTLEAKPHVVTVWQDS